MNHTPTVLLLGATGRTGLRVLDHLTRRGVRVRAIARSPEKIPAELGARPGVELIEATLLDLDDASLDAHVRGVDAVICTLGHVMSLKGVFGAPRDLVTQAVARVTGSVRRIGAPRPTRLVLMTSVSVNQPQRGDARRGGVERAFIAALRAVLPPAADNQSAADYLLESVGPDDGRLDWVIVRPDALQDGIGGPFALHEGLVDSVFAPGKTTMDNIGAFMADLVTDTPTWARWRGKLPVIVDTAAGDVASRRAA